MTKQTSSSSFLQKLARGSAVLISLSALALASCGDSDDIFDNDDSAEVEDLRLDDSTLSLGEATVLRTEFSYSSDGLFNDGERAVVVIRLPQEVRFREGSSEIQRPIDDNSTGAQVVDCDSGEQYLLFDLDDNDLARAENPSGDADAELSLTVDSVAAGSQVIISARARENSVFFQCGQPFDSDRDVVLTIVE